MRRTPLIVCALAASLAFANTDEAARRHAAPITVTTPAPFVQLPLPPAAYARSASANLADLRMVDARGERVPFAVLAPRRPEASTVERARDATLYPLPARPLPDGGWRLPIEVAIDGERVSVRRGGAPTAAPVAMSAGWLIDLGERKRDDPPPQSLRFAWRGPAEFTVGFRFETSDDLRAWRPGGAGQLMALASPAGALTQPTVVLRADTGRFVRLVWADVAQAPQVSGVKVLTGESKSRVLDAPTEIVLAATPEPPGKAAPDDDAKRALHFDLGGVLPVAQVDLRWPSGTRVAPVRLQARDDTAQPWRDLTAAVFYRLERDKEEAATSTPLALATSARFLRVLPDPRAAALDAAQTQLVVQATLASLVFAAQGQPPYVLQAGARVAAPSALPVATLVPSPDTERARFGRATLGDWSEAADVARAVAAAQQRAALRPWLLWSVLLAGVAILGLMVWRLSRPRPGA
jgi:Protein of unknown function (DUF3999)